MSNNNPLVIEVHGTGIHNRGAELMTIAIFDRLKKFYPNVRIAVSPNFGFPRDIKRYDLLTVTDFHKISKKGLISLIIGLFTGRNISKKGVDVVLDASGFAFSDQWGSEYAENLNNKMISQDRKNQKLILLPQALGPFENNEVKQACESLFNRSSIVFARDSQSYDYASAIIDTSKLKQCPDFTVSVNVLEKNSVSLPENFVAIVPNMRMMDKAENSDKYLIFLRKAINIIKSKGLNPVFVAHDAKEDLNIIPMLGEEYLNLQVYQDEDPRVLKWLLGQSLFVIGSRFHALVSTLSQGVPCIGAGWSHKYPELFSDFSTRDTLVDDLMNLELLEKQIILLADPNYRKQKSEEIKCAATTLKYEVDQMWLEIKRQIDQKCN